MTELQQARRIRWNGRNGRIRWFKRVIYVTFGRPKHVAITANPAARTTSNARPSSIRIDDEKHVQLMIDELNIE